MFDLEDKMNCKNFFKKISYKIYSYNDFRDSPNKLVIKSLKNDLENIERQTFLHGPDIIIFKYKMFHYIKCHYLEGIY